jgi:crossover junction endodeoxyribonuclease RusA
MTTIELPYPPSSNRYWRVFRGHPVKSDEARNYQTQAGWLAKAAGVHDPLSGAVALSIWLYRPRKTGDLDNRLKVLIDSLNGVAWNDDKQVVEIHAYLRDDKQNPRAIIGIEQRG